MIHARESLERTGRMLAGCNVAPGRTSRMHCPIDGPQSAFDYRSLHLLPGIGPLRIALSCSED